MEASVELTQQDVGFNEDVEQSRVSINMRNHLDTQSFKTPDQ